MGWVSLRYDWDWTTAGKHFERALALNPAYPLAHHEYAGYLNFLGRSDEALAERKRTLDLDPVSPLFNSGMAYQLYCARRFDEAIEQARKTLDIDPSFPHTHFGLGAAYAAKGMYGEARAEFEKLPDHRRDIYPAYVRARLGERAEALRVIGELRALYKKGDVTGYSFAVIYLGLGEKDQAFAWLEKALDEHSISMIGLKVDPIWDPLRSDPRFADLVRRMGLPP